jgi:hypothetical protein
MTFLLALFTTMAGAIVGFALGAAIGAVAAAALGMSSFEGVAGYFVIFFCAPLGGLIGMIIGAVWMLWRRGVRTFGGIAGRFALIVVTIAALSAGGVSLMFAV